MKKYKTCGEIDFLLYKPKIFKLFHYKFFNITIREYLRFLIAKLRGSRIHYILEKGYPIGLCVIEKGSGRYTFCSKNDIIIAPIYIKEEKRGEGWSYELLKTVIAYEKKTVWAIILKSNIASIKAHEKIGFQFFGYVTVKGQLRKWYLTNDSNERLLFRYEI